MRTVVVHLAGPTLLELRAWLDGAVRRNVDQWLVETLGDPVIFLHAGKPGPLDEPGFPSTSKLVMDVSGRHDGREEVIGVLRLLLTRFDGVVADEYTDEIWRLEEILKGARKLGHTFFDTVGWSRHFRDGQDSGGDDDRAARESQDG